MNFYDRFADQAPDFADAALVYRAERENVDRIFTLDFVDFVVYRTSENRALTVVGM